MVLLIFLEDSLTQKELKRVEGCFITSAILEICPVKRIEDKEFFLEKPKVFRKNGSAYEAFAFKKVRLVLF